MVCATCGHMAMVFVIMHLYYFSNTFLYSGFGKSDGIIKDTSMSFSNKGNIEGNNSRKLIFHTCVCMICFIFWTDFVDLTSEMF